MNLQSKSQLRTLAKTLVRDYFRDDRGKPFDLSDTQADVFLTIFARQFARNQVIAPTQYGKSTIVAMALLLRSQTFAEDWAIVTGEMPKSMIIMGKVIHHLFDDAGLLAKLELEPGQALDRLRRERTKEHLTWKGGGSIRTFTADARNRQRVKAALAGFGSPNIVEDESGLLSNDIQAMIMRMLGGHRDNFILKIGNPWNGNPNHFYKTWHQNNYNRIFIDYKVGLAEGRYSKEFIEEMRDLPFFDILYECKFPMETAILEGGYRKLLTTQEIEQATHPDPHVNIIQAATGKSRLGVDVGRGGNYTSYCLRYDNIAKIIERNRDPDLMAQVARVKQFIETYNISPEMIFIDDVGVGGGVTDRLREYGINVTGIREGAKATDPNRYANLRAEIFWEAAQWVKAGGQLVKDDGWMQMSLINYKEDSASRLKMEPKGDLLKRGIESPDDADAFSLTFSPSVEWNEGDFEIV